MAVGDQQAVKNSTFAPLSRMISPERFSTYLTAAGHDEDRALRLYVWNAQLGEAFHTPIQAVEVGLRNSINHALKAEFGIDWWQASAFAKQADRERLGDIDLVLRRIAKRGATSDNGQVVAGLSFGFWVALLQPRYNPAVWSKHLRAAFPELPAAETRASLSDKAREIAFLRNRISHHEPIIKRNTSKDFADLMLMLKWMCPKTHEWVRPQCRVSEIMRKKP